MMRIILDLYFAPKFFEKSCLIYKLLGVHIFKKFLPTGDYVIRLTKIKFIPNGSTKTLKGYETYTRIYETVHLTGCIFMTSFLVIDFTVLTLVLNLVINVYPIMVQRYNRGRIYKILQKRKRRLALTATRPKEGFIIA